MTNLHGSTWEKLNKLDLLKFFCYNVVDLLYKENSMEYLSKVSLDKKVYREYMVKISAVGTISLAGLILGIYSLIIGNYLFVVWYFIAFVLGFSYTVMRINTVFPTFAATDGEKLFMSVWINGILPYKLPENPGFLSDFIPERVKTDEILISDIDSMFIGSKKFLLRNLTEEEYPRILKQLDGDRHYESVLKRMDFMYVRTADGENCFMSVTGFDVKKLSELIEIVEKNCMGVKIHTNLPKLVRIRSKFNKA